jgi:phenylalanyl-tRNA synthetase beta chain
MPVIGISVKALHTLLHTELSEQDAERLLNEIGCDVDGVVNVRRFKSRFSDYVIEVAPKEALPLTDSHSGVTKDKPEELWEPIGEETVVRLDLLPVRPDIFDAGGLSRALRGYMGAETGLRDYSAAEAQWRVEVDERITDPHFGRPLIQCAVVRSLPIDDETLRAIMKLQENLHWALARDRKFASIGAYDLDKLENPVRYTLVDRSDFRFTPLFWGGREPVSPETMLSEHPKGVDYAHLVEGMEELPALIAANDAVLSLPPIINAEETRLTTATTNVLIDVTGHNLPIVTKALNIMATSLAELDPAGQAQIELVEMVYPDRTELTPHLAPEEFTVDPAGAAKLIGVELSRADVKLLLEKMRHGVTDPGEGPLGVKVAAYRHDIMHEVDLIEDIAIAYGYHNIPRTLVPTFTAGQAIAMNDRARRAADALCGLGYLETLSLVLTSERDHYEKMRREESGRRARLQNPISVDQTMLRENLYSSLLSQLAMNTDHPLPQKIFEVGDVVSYDGVAADEPEPRELKVIAGALIATRAGYAEGRSALDALLRETGFAAAPTATPTAGAGKRAANETQSQLEYRAEDNPSALPGRSAGVYSTGGGTGGSPVAGTAPQKIAEVFEVHPEVLENFRLGNPVVLFSLTLGPVEYGDG